MSEPYSRKMIAKAKLAFKLDIEVKTESTWDYKGLV
jgi:hypothetical protein